MRFELTVLRICNPFPWTTRAPLQKLNLVQYEECKERLEVRRTSAQTTSWLPAVCPHRYAFFLRLVVCELLFHTLAYYILRWSEWKDSNLRSPAPKAGGLSQAFLHSVYFFRSRLGIFSSSCGSANLVCVPSICQLSAVNTRTGFQ